MRPCNIKDYMRKKLIAEIYKDGLKRCSMCREYKQFNEFDLRGNNRPGHYKSKCIICDRKYDVEYKRKLAKLPGHSEKLRKRNLKQCFNLTLEQFDFILKLQNECCDICGVSFSVKKPHVDHNHNSAGKEVRGLLCPECNKGLGMFQDNPEFLRSAAMYLEENTSVLNAINIT